MKFTKKMRMGFLALLVIVGSMQAYVAYAQTAFGGQITYVQYCSCSQNFLVYFNDLTISPPVSLPLIYQPGATILYPYGQIYRPGVWILGLWNSGGSCSVYCGVSCCTIPSAGTMQFVGTSR